jgi:hypothetical protein
VVRAASGRQGIFNLFDDGVGDRGDVLTVQLLVGDGMLSTTASATAVVANSAPILNVTLSDGEPRRTDTLVATSSAVDPDGDAPVTFTYTWSIGKKVRQVTSTTATTDRFDLRSYSPGDLVTLSVVATDGSDTSAPVTTTARIARR